MGRVELGTEERLSETQRIKGLIKMLIKLISQTHISQNNISKNQNIRWLALQKETHSIKASVWKSQATLFFPVLDILNGIRST